MRRLVVLASLGSAVILISVVSVVGAMTRLGTVSLEGIWSVTPARGSPWANAGHVVTIRSVSESEAAPIIQKSGPYAPGLGHPLGTPFCGATSDNPTGHPGASFFSFTYDWLGGGTLYGCTSNPAAGVAFYTGQRYVTLTAFPDHLGGVWYSTWDKPKSAASLDLRQSTSPGSTSGEPPGSATVTITAVTTLEDVSVRHGNGDWADLAAGAPLKAGDEVHTGPGSQVQLHFSDGSIVTIKELTQLKIATLIGRTDRVSVVLLLKIGELKARVQRQESAAVDFSVRPPIATAGVRGTIFSVFYDAVSKVAIVSTEEGTVSVDPTKHGLPTKAVKAGQEVAVTAKAITRVTAVGEAGARGGVNRAEAFALAEQPVSSATTACGISSPRGTKAFSVEPSTGGWLVTIEVTGSLQGASTWNIADGQAQPANPLAEQIAAGCH